MSLPYLTPDFPGVGGVIKQRPDDFFVQELPLYEPTGEGEHVYVEIQKIGLSHFDAIDRIAYELHVSPRDIGYAGMKDAHAITRQTLSIWGTTEEKVLALKIPNLTINSAIRHVNKLRLGHLAGNRFAIKIRDVDPASVVRMKPLLERIEQVGMPNYFGEQRFGRRNNNDLLGAALIGGNAPALLKLLLGSPDPKIDDPKTVQARRAFDAGNPEMAMKLMPRSHGMERRILARFIKTKKAGAAVKAVDQKLRRLWVSALQSRLFNDVVAQRITSLDKLLLGDLAWKHDTGSVFSVEDLAAEQPRADRFDISPTGPLIGYRCTLPAGEPLAIEESVFAAHNLKPQDFRQEGREKVKGARRPLRIQPKDLDLQGGSDAHGPYITTAFTLPPGSFATILLRELMKDDAEEMTNDELPNDETMPNDE
ncbi:MAG TPA: tRNA pseudouridine(13) synthase TruD [Tepidisphaeraceae bacterium]|jgi:tRNA pseudouridine13 synthase|nr:tRNA pseudouridine(13) synthase TruD [Tepidisphaeraceae bacterium]